MIKAEAILVNDEGVDWTSVKEAVKAKLKDIDTKTLTNIIVLSTVGKDVKNKDSKADLFETLEPEIMLKMKHMNLSDLINLFWSVQEIGKGNEQFY